MQENWQRAVMLGGVPTEDLSPLKIRLLERNKTQHELQDRRRVIVKHYKAVFGELITPRRRNQVGLAECLTQGLGQDQLCPI